MTAALASGVVHTMPSDLRKVLLNSPAAQKTWNDTTPLARNEWICLVISGKQAATRIRRLERARSQLSAGQRRPCCWTGCPHREKTGKI